MNNDGIFFSDNSAYWLQTGASNNWGLYWDTTANTLEFTGGGTSRAEVDLDTGNLQLDGTIDSDGTGTNYFAGRLDAEATTDASGTAGTGVIEVGNALRIDGDEIITNANTPLYLQNDNNGDLQVDGGTLFVDASTNSVGVGLTNPGYLFNVKRRGAVASQTVAYIEGGSTSASISIYGLRVELEPEGYGSSRKGTRTAITGTAKM